jgi:hypothetical protein
MCPNCPASWLCRTLGSGCAARNAASGRARRGRTGLSTSPKAGICQLAIGADHPELDSSLVFLRTSIGNRKGFANAAALGLAAVELRPHDTKAVDEIRKLFGYLFDAGTVSNLNRKGA